MPPARARTVGLSPFGSSTGTSRPMFVASTPHRRQVSWLADRRLILPSRRQMAASGARGRDFPLTVAGAAADLADAGGVASPHSLFALLRGTVDGILSGRVDGFVNGSRYSTKSRSYSPLGTRFCAPLSSTKATAGFGRRDIIWTMLSAAATGLRKLLLRELEVAPILRLHQFDRMRNVGLPVRRPGQHPIEDFFHLFFCHSASIAGCFL